jgi:hypothetical protein
MNEHGGVADSVRQACLSNPMVSHLNEETIQAALDGMSVQPIKSYAWISLAVQSAMHYGSELTDRQDIKKSKAAVRAELTDFSDRLQNLWQDIFNSRFRFVRDIVAEPTSRRYRRPRHV